MSLSHISYIFCVSQCFLHFSCDTCICNPYSIIFLYFATVWNETFTNTSASKTIYLWNINTIRLKPANVTTQQGKVRNCRCCHKCFCECYQWLLIIIKKKSKWNILFLFEVFAPSVEVRTDRYQNTELNSFNILIQKKRKIEYTEFYMNICCFPFGYSFKW